MATSKQGLLNADPYASPANPGGTKAPAQQTQNSNPYQGGLTTDFSGYGGWNNGAPGSGVGAMLNGGADFYGPDSAWSTANNKYQHDVNSSDSDVRNAANLSWEIQNPNSGTDSSAQSALLDMYKGRIGEKNSLAEQIAGGGDQLNQAQDVNRATAGAALGQGLKNTRQNFNSRGLLYSGMRQVGEEAVKSGVSSQLASSMTGTARDSANSVQAAKNAYASVDLANQQDTLNRANQAFDTASANNIARLQAMQQLGSGVGSAVGTVAGSYYSPSGSSYQNPTSGWNPGVSSDGSMPQLGSQYGSTPQYGLLAGNQNQAAVGQ